MRTRIELWATAKLANLLLRIAARADGLATTLVGRYERQMVYAGVGLRVPQHKTWVMYRKPQVPAWVWMWLVALVLTMTLAVLHIAQVTPEPVEAPSVPQAAVEAVQEPPMTLQPHIEAKPATPPSVDGISPVVMNTTAYTAFDEGMDGKGITASGAMVCPWYTVAASKSVPFGTRVYIPYFKDKPNGGVFVVQDRGGAITEGHLDVYMPLEQAANDFGRQNLEVYILGGEHDVQAP